MSITAEAPKFFRETVAINLKATGTTVIVPAQASKKVLPLRMYFLRTSTGSGTRPTISLGTLASGFFNITSMASFGESLASADEIIELLYNATTKKVLLSIGTNGVTFNVTAASTYTTDGGIMLFEGLIL